MNANSHPVELVQATMNLVAAYLARSDEKATPERVTQLMGQFLGVAMGLAASAPQPGVAARLDDAFQAQRPASRGPREMTPEARAFIAASTAHVGGEMPVAGAHLDEMIWPGVPEDTRAKFRELIREHNMDIGPDGYPKPRRPIDRLISDDKMQVADPITGDYHTMLKRHLRVAHDLDHEELLAMFGLNEQQLPRSGPRYSEAKALQARRTGLGKNKRPAAAPAPQEAAPARRGSRARALA